MINKDNNTLIIALAIILSLSIHAFFIGGSLQKFQKENRYISVKGFAEKEVKSDLAVWTIKLRNTTNDINQGSKELELNKNKLINFLKQRGIKQNEIIQLDLTVDDKMAREYASNDIGAFRYILENSLQIRSSNVENIEQVSRMNDELLKIGVVISASPGYMNQVKYMYTKLNQIKPQMLTEATRNAKKAAIQFTTESDVSLDDLRKANQGLFTIIDRDESAIGQGEGGYYQNLNDVYKKVRVVVSVDYYIK